MPPILAAPIEAGSGPIFRAERCEAAIDLAADDAGAGFHPAGVGIDFAGGEAFADQGQHAIGDGLPGQAGAGGAEGDRGFVRPGCGQHRFEVVFRFDDGDDFRDQAVEAGVGAVGQAAQFVGDDLVGWQRPAQGGGDGAQALSLSRSRSRFGAGFSGVRTVVHGPWFAGISPLNRLPSQVAIP